MIPFYSKQHVYTFVLYPLRGEKKRTFQDFAGSLEFTLFFQSSISLTAHQLLDFHMDNRIWLPKGTCLLINKGKIKRTKMEIFSEFGPIKVLQKQFYNV